MEEIDKKFEIGFQQWEESSNNKKLKNIDEITKLGYGHEACVLLMCFLNGLVYYFNNTKDKEPQFVDFVIQNVNPEVKEKLEKIKLWFLYNHYDEGKKLFGTFSYDIDENKHKKIIEILKENSLNAGERNKEVDFCNIENILNQDNSLKKLQLAEYIKRFRYINIIYRMGRCAACHTYDFPMSDYLDFNFIRNDVIKNILEKNLKRRT